MRFIKCFSLDTFVITIAIIIIVFPVSACRLPVSEDLAENKCSPSTYCLLTKYANDTSGKEGSRLCSTKIHLWVDLMILYLFFPVQGNNQRKSCGSFVATLHMYADDPGAALHIYLFMRGTEQNMDKYV